MSQVNSTSTRKASSKKVLHFDDLPPWLQDNQYIQSGYRAPSNSVVGSFWTVFGVHNETVNIWTHLLPSVWFVGALVYFLFYRLPSEPARDHIHPLSSLLPVTVADAEFSRLSFFGRLAYAARQPSVTATDVAVLTVFLAGATAMFSLSWTYHTLSNHSPSLARFFNKLDYLGIVAMILGSFAPTIYYGYYCDRRLMVVYLVVLNGLGFVCGVVTLMDRFRTPRWRPARAGMFVALGLAGVFPVLGALYTTPAHAIRNHMSLSHTVAQGALYITGATIYACRWPEKNAFAKTLARHRPQNNTTPPPIATSADSSLRNRKSAQHNTPSTHHDRLPPGTFDIVGASHQIFHVFVVAAGFVHFVGILEAFAFRHGVLAGKCAV
ncbi:hypothetical protein PYCC9005_005828 [Savitreella phatthalungensis]